MRPFGPRPFVVLASAVLVLGIAGCSSDSADTESTAAATAPAATASAATTVAAAAPGGITDPVIDSRSFTSTSITEAGVERALAGPEPVTLAVVDGGISVQAGCNTLFGGASIDAGVLTIDGVLASTMMACEPELMDQDQWLAQFLSSSPTVTVTDTELTLTSGDTVMTLTPVETVGLYDTPLPEAGDAEAVTALCEELVAAGATVDEATARGESAGHVLRIVKQDGEPLPATMDFNPGRLNLVVEGDVVTGCSAG